MLAGLPLRAPPRDSAPINVAALSRENYLPSSRLSGTGARRLCQADRLAFWQAAVSARQLAATAVAAAIITRMTLRRCFRVLSLLVPTLLVLFLLLLTKRVLPSLLFLCLDLQLLLALLLKQWIVLRQLLVGGEDRHA